MWRLPAARTKVANIALTFDDGPDPRYTPATLDLLKAHGVKATFFVIGEKVQQYPELVRRMALEGHAIGGHTWHHQEIIGAPANTLHADLLRCRRAILAACGIDSMLFRPPRGRVSLAAIHRVCARGYCLVHWSKTYSDYQRDGVSSLIERFRQHPPVARDIVLLHDHNQFTIDALATLIPQWRSDGLQFSALPMQPDQPAPPTWSP